MKKILAILLCLILNLYAQNSEGEDQNILSALNSIQTINSQIKILSNQKDANKTSISANLAILNEQKRGLLEKVPSLITQIQVNASDSKKFYENKARLEKEVLRYQNSQNSDKYMLSLLSLEHLKVDEIFFKAILQIQENFKTGAKSKTLKDTLAGALIDLRTSSYESIKSLKDSMDMQKFTTEFDELELHKITCEEILIYLRDNADLLGSNSFLRELNLQVAIDYIDSKISFKIWNLSIGKLVIIVFVLVFFISLTRILAILTYHLALSLFAKNVYGDAIKDQIIKIIKRPISSLLVAYALSVCISVVYYPEPTPVKITNWFIIVYILFFAWLVLTILNGYGILLISELTKKSGRKEIVNLILKIIYCIVFLIAILAILSRFGFDISAIIASLGIGGLAVAFAAKDIIANFFASVMLLFDNSFSQGDWINCGGIEGTIVEIGLRKTTIRSFDNALIFVPNSKLASEPITNWTRRKVGRLLDITIGVTYDAKPQQILNCIDDIEKMLIANPKISRPNNGGSFDSSDRHLKFKQNIVSINDLAGYKSDMYVSLAKLNDSSIDISVYCFTKSVKKADFLQIRQEIIINIMNIIAKNGLEFAFPSQSLYVQNSSKDATFGIKLNKSI